MIKPLLTATLLTALATQASALSCLLPDVTATYAEAQNSPEAYVVLLGEFSFNTRLLPGDADPVKQHIDRSTSIPAQFRGHALSTNGFTTPYNIPVTLEIGCIASWCGGMSPNQEVLAFVRQTETGHSLDVGACPFFVFQPDANMQTRVTQCMQGGPCEAKH
jgi:hypothetical protein